ncbi:MAG: threonine--tRNA ligase [Actinomycetota bacterium]|jgi:threonyl-tRNA synthetase|nr:threonine--tRNA ligase [Actinomycetota bacterium]
MKTKEDAEPGSSSPEDHERTRDPGNTASRLERIRHSCAHVLAQATKERFSETGTVHIATGPPTETGFYYDFELPRPVVPEDLEWIDQRVKEILSEGHAFVRSEVDESSAREIFANEPFKQEILDGILAGNLDDNGVHSDGGPPVLSTYTHSSFVDLCAGPHVDNTDEISPDAVKVLNAAGAYWRGDEKRPMLQRIYGTAWETREALDHFLWQRSEAERRDHRKLGRELDMFMFDQSAPGMPYWLPNGLCVLNRLLDFSRTEHEKRGYQEVSTPLVNEKSLWETSGHWEHYVDNMFVIPIDEHRTYGVKPMNCPSAMIIFNRRTWSYRDLPLRLSDLDVLHRHERSGTLQGLLRVQSFRQDDAHIFLAESDIGEELGRIFEIIELFYSTFGLEYRLRMGTRPSSFLGDVNTWDHAESALKHILDESIGGDRYVIAEGDGAFYGPKIDIIMRDALDREWQMGTVQLDFQLPRRFGCSYVKPDGTRDTPVVVHRAIYGSLERFLAVLLEHTAGALPPWLVPCHVALLPVRTEHTEPAKNLVAELSEASLCARVMEAAEGSIGARVREARLARIPYILVLGDREASGGTLAVRLREGGEIRDIERSDAISRMHRTLIERHRTTDVAFADLLGNGQADH